MHLPSGESVLSQSTSTSGTSSSPDCPSSTIYTLENSTVDSDSSISDNSSVTENKSLSNQENTQRESEVENESVNEKSLVFNLP